MEKAAIKTASSQPAPAHVAIIMDGNGRWAKARGLPRTAGHKRGAEAVRRTVEAACELGISYLTLYAFSAENWKRPEGEVMDLMGLLRLYLRNEVNNLNKNGVRLRVIGDRTRLGKDLVSLIEESEAKTASNARLTLVLALSYGSRQEILNAAKQVARDVAAGRLAPEAITEEWIAANLYTRDMPDPDVLIRTSGEQRLSNFLLWQSAYTEFVFTPVLWPDFSKADLEAALSEFHGRDRRFGGSGV